MKTLLRIGAVALLAAVLGVWAMPASAQMMHYELNVTLNLTSTQLLTGGTVCVSGEVDDICQDIAPGSGPNPGYTFTGLGGGDHTVTVNGDPYLEAVTYVTLIDDVTNITIDLQMEELPNLPNTGAGTTAGAPVSTGFLAATGALALLSAAFLLRRRTVETER